MTHKLDPPCRTLGSTGQLYRTQSHDFDLGAVRDGYQKQDTRLGDVGVLSHFLTLVLEKYFLYFLGDNTSSAEVVPTFSAIYCPGVGSAAWSHCKL